MSACIPDIFVRLFGFVRVFSLSLCCLLACHVYKDRYSRFPLSGSLRDRVDNQLFSILSTDFHSRSSHSWERKILLLVIWPFFVVACSVTIH
jgi:hypothetical protein